MEFYPDILLPIFQKTEQIDVLIRKNYGQILTNYTVSEMHCLDCIQKTEKPNVTKLALALNLTKAGTSKMLKRLLLRHAVQIFTDANNKKEVYYSLTATGKKVFNAHSKLHKNWNNYTQQFLDQYSPAEIKTVVKTLNEYGEYLQNLLDELNEKENHETQS